MRLRKKTPKNSNKSARRAQLLGLGLDAQDGHFRVTKGENFQIIGGSHDTHAVMQEKALKFNEELNKRKRRIENLSRDEFLEIADKLKLG